MASIRGLLSASTRIGRRGGGRIWRTSGRLLRIYAVRDWIIIAAACLLAFLSYREAKEAVSIADLPERQALGIAVNMRQPTADARRFREVLPYRADVTVGLTRGCRNPVTVELIAAATKWEIPRFASAGPIPRSSVAGPTAVNQGYKPTTVEIGISDSTARSFESSIFSSRRPRPVVRRLMAELPLGSSARGWLVTHRLRSLGGDSPVVRLVFAADWVRHRGSRSCFIVLPDLIGWRRGG